MLYKRPGGNIGFLNISTILLFLTLKYYFESYVTFLERLLTFSIKHGINITIITKITKITNLAKLMNSKKYTTFEIGDICGVAVSTITDWIESGKIKAYKTLGGHRRVAEEDLVCFLKQNNFPIPEEISPDRAKKILVIDDEEFMLDYIQKMLETAEKKYEIALAANGFEAGDKINLFKPDP